MEDGAALKESLTTRLMSASEADPIIRFFLFTHLPPDKLKPISEVFAATAMFVVESLPRNAERTVALRKLLEAKDAAIRAAL
jgi:hypothetical protein